MSWLDDLNQFIPPIRRLDIERAKYFVVADGKTLDHVNVISQLNFGFWRSFLVRWNKDNVWPNALLTTNLFINGISPAITRFA